MLSTYSVLNDLNSIFDAFIEPQYNVKNELSYFQYDENEDAVTVKFMVPGATSDDIDIQLENNVLRLSFEKKQDKLEVKYIRRERSYGTFSKTIKLPYRVDPEKVHADLNEGILTVKLEKAEEAKPKKIEVK